MSDIYNKYVAFLKKLSLLDSDGKLESNEADELRDEMEGLWEAMSEVERDKSRLFRSKVIFVICEESCIDSLSSRKIVRAFSNVELAERFLSGLKSSEDKMGDYVSYYIEEVALD